MYDYARSAGQYKHQLKIPSGVDSMLDSCGLSKQTWEHIKDGDLKKAKGAMSFIERLINLFTRGSRQKIIERAVNILTPHCQSAHDVTSKIDDFYALKASLPANYQSGVNYKIVSEDDQLKFIVWIDPNSEFAKSMQNVDFEENIFKEPVSKPSNKALLAMSQEQSQFFDEKIAGNPLYTASCAVSECCKSSRVGFFSKYFELRSELNAIEASSHLSPEAKQDVKYFLKTSMDVTVDELSKSRRPEPKFDTEFYDLHSPTRNSLKGIQVELEDTDEIIEEHPNHSRKNSQVELSLVSEAEETDEASAVKKAQREMLEGGFEQIQKINQKFFYEAIKCILG
ncbi:hypothetical protein [Parashewanella hymeniacidonis]|uniref:hypothetical protein n=1 Tax=Parashewanella hymeniacidonis TaxID=2807618 RepID=UPI001961009C|nr:hypothetical protein [Parashewanella hymeniacidonis]